MADQGTPRREQSAGVETFQFRLWGRFSARRQSDGADVTPRGRKARALLAFLLLDDKPALRERLAALLWGERGQAQAHGSLRQTLIELREFSQLIEADRYQIHLAKSDVRTDLDDAMQGMARDDAVGLAALLSAGTSLLEDLDGIDPTFDQWLRSVRAEVGQALLARAHAWGRGALESGDVNVSEKLARRLLSIDPLDESAARLAMEAAHKAGHQETVRRVYDELAASLRGELGVAPSEETVSLHDRLTTPAVPRRASEVDAQSTAQSVPAEEATTLHATRKRRLVLLGAALFLLLLVGVAGLVTWRTMSRSEVPASIAVLPFRNLSSGDEYFAEGIAEEILSQLGREPQMRVAGRTSSWMFKDLGADLRDVGRRLDVAYVLEGSVRRAGSRVRVNVALVQTDDGMRLWSRAFDGRLDDIFAIQRDIGLAVAGQLRRQLVHAAPVTGPLTTRGDVYTLYLTARGLIRTREPAKIDTAKDLLRSAVRVDPNYAPAWASLGAATALAFSDRRQSETEAEARGYIRRALTLAPDLGEAHAALSMISHDNLDIIGGLERAVRSAPVDAELWYALGNARANRLDFPGQLEALRQVARIDPFWVRAEAYSSATWERGHRRESLRFDQRMVRDHPEPMRRLAARARLAMFRHDWSEAYRYLQEANRLVPSTAQARSSLDPIFILFRLGRFDELQRTTRLPPLLINQARGETLSLEQIVAFLGEERAFWSVAYFKTLVAHQLLNAGRGGDLLTLYDRSFSSPDAMALRHPFGRFGFLEDAPAVAVALREADRNAEAERMLNIADRMIRPALRRGEVPSQFYEISARTWAVQGRRELALRALERAVALGWQYDHLAAAPPLAEEPVYRSIRNDPRIRRLDAVMQADIARERREARAPVI